jgi:hypothetical protein
MKRLALGILAVTLAACGGAGYGAAPAAAPRPAVTPDAQLFALDKGFMFPLTNGSRITIENGWIEPRFDGMAPQKSIDLDVVVGSDTGADASEVTISYEMLEMAHGLQRVTAVPAGAGHHRARIGMGMYGTWKISVRVVLAGATSTAVLLLAGTGL